MTDSGGLDGRPKALAIRPGVRLGVDVGDVRIGVARSDAHGLLATPVETVRRGAGDVERLIALTVEHEVLEIVVGLPRLLSGRLGTAAEKAADFARTLVSSLAAAPGAATRDVSVRLVDERLTTVSAERVLREQGRIGKARRAVVDQAAAVVILQHALDTERSTGRPPGQEVGETS